MAGGGDDRPEVFRAALAGIPDADIAKWATEAGYSSDDDRVRFRHYLEYHVANYRAAVGLRAAPQQRKDFSAVSSAAANLLLALSNLDVATHDILTTDSAWPTRSGGRRVSVPSLIDIASRVANVTGYLSTRPAGMVPGQKHEKSGARGDHIKALACSLAWAYAQRHGGFNIGTAAKKVIAGDGPRFKNRAAFWLWDILKALITDADANEINDATGFARSNYNNLAKLLAEEDAESSAEK